MKSVRYGLWAMPVNDECIVFATENEFVRIGNRRILVYRPDEDGIAEMLPKSAVRVTDEVAKKALTENEMRWLTRCNLTVIERITDKYRIPMEKAVPDFLKRLQTELEDIRRAKNAKKETESSDPETGE